MDGSGLVYLRARYYDPTSGRFSSRDRLPGWTGEPGTLNRYAYANNGPTNLLDPSGLQPLSPIPCGVWLCPPGLTPPINAATGKQQGQARVQACPDNGSQVKRQFVTGVYGLVRGPEMDRAGQCHVNIQATARFLKGLNFHVYFAGGEFVSQELPPDVFLGDNPGIAAAVLSSVVAEWISDQTGLKPDPIWAWFVPYATNALEQLKSYELGR